MSHAVFAEKSVVPKAAPQVTKPAAGSLRIGEPNDAFEKEADRVADQIMAGDIGGHSLLASAWPARLQRKCSCGSGSATGQCEACQQREEEPLVQRKATGASAPAIAPPIVHAAMHSPGRPLDQATRSFFEPRFQFNFSEVRIHSDRLAADSASAVGALAYTVGPEMVFGEGQYAPNSPEGRRLVAHELTHVVQQAGADARQGLTLRRQAGQQQGSASNPCPTSTSIDTYRQFNHSNLPPSQQLNFRTYLGMLVRHDLSPGPDHTGHCAQEELSLLSTDCPASVTTALSSCSKRDCLPVNRAGQDRPTGTALPSNRKAFLDLHRTTSTRSILEGTGKNSCRVACEQKYHCDSLGAPVLGVFRITRNFRADTFTPPGGSPQHITTGEVEKVESFGKGDFPTRTLPKGEEYA